jgi:two-component system, response regulator PdtaR
MDLHTGLILVVEDEALIRMVAVAALVDEGFEVIEAEHAAEAIEHLEAHGTHVRVLFTDIHMPGEMDGLRLAHHAHTHWPSIGIIVCSGLAAPKPLEMPHGSRFVRKPYAPEHVLNHVRELAA